MSKGQVHSLFHNLFSYLLLRKAKSVVVMEDKEDSKKVSWKQIPRKLVIRKSVLLWQEEREKFNWEAMGVEREKSTNCSLTLF